MLAACLITVNWAVYIWGVNNGHVVETSLGYFVNPLVTVLMGVFILGERLRRWQWVALGVAPLAVVVLTLDYGRPPWIALTLALTFGSYGLCKKQANAPAIESLTFETMVIGPVALGYLAWLQWAGGSTLPAHGPGHVLLLMSAGIVTAVPLVCFGGAAIRVPLVTLGLLQYLTPTLQFALGVLYFHEDMPAGRWGGFVMVLVALIIFTVESLRHRRRTPRPTAEAAIARPSSRRRPARCPLSPAWSSLSWPQPLAPRGGARVDESPGPGPKAPPACPVDPRVCILT